LQHDFLLPLSLKQTAQMTFRRSQFRKAILEAERLDFRQCQVLNLMANLSASDGTIRFSDLTRGGIACRMGWGIEKSCNVVSSLIAAGILSTITRDKRRYWQLPTVEALAKYEP
jgi:hypothetical protein